MNIIKILDAHVPVNFTDKEKTMFGYVKDKYCYLINWKWIVPFEYTTVNSETGEETTFSFSTEQYIECSVNDHAPVENYPYAEYTQYVACHLIDIALTEKANSVVRFIEANKFSSDSEITLDELKCFRTWLAKALYNVLNGIAEYDIIEMLNYYRLEMNDTTIKHLTHFAPATAIDILNTMVKSTCGCQGSTSANLIGSVNTCDPIYLYRKAVYEKMVTIFSEITFWTERENELLVEIKKYIDGIIAHNLPLVSSQYVSDLYDCGCLSDANASQERLMNILKNLSKAFGFMIEDQVTGNRNFIGDTLNQWAAYLYEKMRWY